MRPNSASARPLGFGLKLDDDEDHCRLRVPGLSPPIPLPFALTINGIERALSTVWACSRGDIAVRMVRLGAEKVTGAGP